MRLTKRRAASPSKQRRWYAGKSLLALVLFLIPPFAVAFFGGQWTETGPSTWYDGLDRPSWEPPGWLFSVAWTLLYFSMGVAAWLIWLTKSKLYTEGLPLLFWGVQLGINLSWTYAFFQWESIEAGIAVLLLLWFALVQTIVLFAPKSKTAALLLLPYLLWISFALALNIQIGRLN